MKERAPAPPLEPRPSCHAQSGLVPPATPNQALVPPLGLHLVAFDEPARPPYPLARAGAPCVLCAVRYAPCAVRCALCAVTRARGGAFERDVCCGGVAPSLRARPGFFPWCNFYKNAQRSFLMKEELVAGVHGIEGRYPFLDPKVVQEYLWLK